MKKYHNILFLLKCLIIIALNFPVHAQNTTPRPSWWAVKVNSTGLENLYKLNDSIYRSEQPDSIKLDNLKKIGIKSILNLTKDQNDTVIFGNRYFYFYSLPMKAEHITDEVITKALKTLRDAPKPILVHCRHGSDHTGVVIAMYRLIFEGRSKKEALRELRKGGYSFNRVFVNIPAYIRKVNIEQIRSTLSKE